MRDFFKKNNLKNTKTRELVLQVIKSSRLPLTAEEIYKQTIDNNINLSTIYRNLNILCENNILIKQVRQDGKAYFQLNQKKHKHVLICLSCGQELPIETCPLEIIIEKLSEQNNFNITSHNIELYGYCSKCNKKDDK